jgi:TonB family protein
MRGILAVLALCVVALGQAAPKHISPEEAEKHLDKRSPPTYPPMVEMARIQGDVILEIIIDESGAASVRRLVTGHPMLVAAAIESANRWKYQPFEVDGKPCSVITFVKITFGHPGTVNEAATRAELLFQDNFWTAEDSAEVALRDRDYAQAAQQLDKARDLLAPVSDGRRHESERWQWMISMGSLAMAQKKYDEAEQHYKRALEFRQTGDKDAPEMAATLADLGRLHADEKRYDLAREEAAQSIAIYQRNFKRVSSRQPRAREVYGRAIAYEALMLLKIAMQQNDHAEGSKQCRTVLDFQNFLDSSDHDSFVSLCGPAISGFIPKG